MAMAMAMETAMVMGMMRVMLRMAVRRRQQQQLRQQQRMVSGTQPSQMMTPRHSRRGTRLRKRLSRQGLLFGSRSASVCRFSTTNRPLIKSLPSAYRLEHPQKPTVTRSPFPKVWMPKVCQMI